MLSLIATQEYSSDGQHSINVVREIPEAEVTNLDEIIHSFTKYKWFKGYMEMVVENGRILRNFLIDMHDNAKYDDYRKKRDPAAQANKLIYDFCSSIGTYVDVMKRSASDEQKETCSTFLSELYDKNFEYRFWARLRNFVVHCSFPFSVVRRSENGTEIRCRRDHLLAFNGWSTVKPEIAAMPEIIDVLPLVDDMCVLIWVIYHQFLYYHIEKISESLRRLSEQLAKIGVDKPIVVRTESIDAFKRGEMKLHPFDFSAVACVQEDIKNHPGIIVKE